jgi:hypothetical protein
VSVLRRQPHGFEGLLTLLVQADALDSPVTECVGPSNLSLNLNSVASDEMCLSRHDYVLTHLDELRRLDPQRTPSLRRTP